ncbi:MAG: Leucyl aminopeptidase [Actinomycetia bacterium]|nr:Leucyl aminopeptidase [Actinomycetes bacterium]
MYGRCSNIRGVTVTLTTSQSAPGTAEADVLVIGVIQTPDGPSAAPGAAGVDEALGGTLQDALTALGATGEADELIKIPATGKLPALVILAVGLGTAPADGVPFDSERLRRAAGTALRDLAGNKLGIRTAAEGDVSAGAARPGKTVALALPAAGPAEAEAVATGALLGAYTFRRYRATPAADIAVTLLTSDDHAAAVARGQVIADAVNLSRDLINTAPLDLPPAALAADAERVAAASGTSVEVLDEAALAAGGYGGILAVGRGSARPPRLVRLSYSHPEATKTVVFVGKGITFDSGGIPWPS